jgi:hypothetical protein
MPGNPLVRFDEGRVGRTQVSPSLLLYRPSAAIHVLAFFSNLARWRVILLRLLTVAAQIGAATVRERLTDGPQHFIIR